VISDQPANYEIFERDSKIDAYVQRV